MKKQHIALKTIMMLCAGMVAGVHADSWDPGDDSAAGATALTNVLETVQQHGPHDTTPGSDIEDWFFIEMDAGSTYYFESSGPDDMVSFLYSDIGGNTQVATDDDSGSNFNFRLVYTAPSTETYYLKVKALFPNATEYTLSYYKELPPTDSWDPEDDTGAGATLLAIDATLASHGPHTLNEADTNDWFRFSLVAGETYRFETVVVDPVTQDSYGSLYSDSNGTVEVSSDDDSGEFDNFQIEYTPEVSGDYYLKVEELYGAPATYSLKYLQIDGDLDFDGMLDAWEIAYFGSTNALPDSLSGDDDSFSNLDEFIAGTDPTNSASFFSITNFLASSMVVEWPSLSGREYSVYWSSNLVSGFTLLTNQLEHSQNSFTDTVHSAENAGFYKVDVQLK